MEETTAPGAVIHQDVMMPMRDGIRLAADIYLPAAEGGGPVDRACPRPADTYVLGQIERGMGRRTRLLPAPRLRARHPGPPLTIQVGG